MAPLKMSLFAIKGTWKTVQIGSVILMFFALAPIGEQLIKSRDYGSAIRASRGGWNRVVTLFDSSASSSLETEIEFRKQQLEDDKKQAAVALNVISSDDYVSLKREIDQSFVAQETAILHLESELEVLQKRLINSYLTRLAKEKMKAADEQRETVARLITTTAGVHSKANSEAAKAQQQQQSALADAVAKYATLTAQATKLNRALVKLNVLILKGSFPVQLDQNTLTREAAQEARCQLQNEFDRLNREIKVAQAHRDEVQRLLAGESNRTIDTTSIVNALLDEKK